MSNHHHLISVFVVIFVTSGTGVASEHAFNFGRVLNGTWQEQSTRGYDRSLEEFDTSYIESFKQVTLDGNRLEFVSPHQELEIEFVRPLKPYRTYGYAAVIDLNNKGRKLRGAVYCNKEQLEFRFPETCHCSRSGFIVSMERKDSIQTQLTGFLVRSPNAFSNEIPFLKAGDEDIRLIVAKNELVRRALTKHIGQRVIVDGVMCRVNERQKDSTVRSERSLVVHSIKQRGAASEIIGPLSDDGVWLPMIYDNGVSLMNCMNGTTQEIFAPLDVSPETQINWTPHCTFSPDGSLVVVGQGLDQQILRLSELTPLKLQSSGGTRLFRKFSPTGAYLVFSIHDHSKLSNGIAIYESRSGRLAGLVRSNDTHQFECEFSKKGKYCRVTAGSSTVQIDLSAGNTIEIE